MMTAHPYCDDKRTNILDGGTVKVGVTLAAEQHMQDLYQKAVVADKHDPEQTTDENGYMRLELFSADIRSARWAP